MVERKGNKKKLKIIYMIKMSIYNLNEYMKNLKLNLLQFLRKILKILPFLSLMMLIKRILM